MPSSIIFTFLDISLAILGLYLVKRHFDKPAGRRIPGPKGLPLIGNLFDVPIENEPLVFTEWQKKYGGMFNTQRSFIGTHMRHSCRRYRLRHCPWPKNHHPKLAQAGRRYSQQEELDLLKSTTFHNGL